MNSWQQTWDELLKSTTQSWGSFAAPADGSATNLNADPEIAALYAQIAQKGDAWLRFADQAVAAWPISEASPDWHMWVDQFTDQLEAAWGDEFVRQNRNWLSGLTHWLQGLRQIAATSAPWMESMPVPGWGGPGRDDASVAAVERAQAALAELSESLLKLTELLMEMQKEAVKQFRSQLHGLVDGETGLDSIEALFDLWTEQREQSYRKLIKEPDYRQSFAACCNAWSALHLHAGQVADQFARRMNMPSRKDFTRLQRDHRALRREIDTLRAQLSELVKKQREPSA